MITIQDVIDIIRRNDIKVDLDNLDPEASLSHQGADSLDMVSILFELEETYNAKIDEKDIEAGKVSSISAMVEYINMCRRPTA